MTVTREQKTSRFVNDLATTVPSADYRPAAGDGLPEKRFRLSTIRERCGVSRVTEQFLADLTARLEHLGLYTTPELKPGVSPDTWIRVTRQRPTPGGVAPQEAALEAFLMASPASLKGVPRGAHLQHQVRVPGTSKRADILALTGNTITVIELKKAGGAPGVGQVVRYMDAWSRSADADDKTVNGILISGVIDDDTRRAADDARIAGHDIRWFVYNLDFSMQEMR